MAKNFKYQTDEIFIQINSASVYTNGRTFLIPSKTENGNPFHHSLEEDLSEKLTYLKPRSRMIVFSCIAPTAANGYHRILSYNTSSNSRSNLE